MLSSHLTVLQIFFFSFCPFGGTLIGSEDVFGRALRHDEIHDLPALVKRHREATQGEKKVSAQMLQEANLSAQSKKWGPAVKGYGTSILLYPTEHGFTGYARALVQIERNRDQRVESLEAKRKDFQEARDLLQTLRVFAKAINLRIEESLQVRMDRDCLCLEQYLIKNAIPLSGECKEFQDVLNRYLTKKK